MFVLILFTSGMTEANIWLQLIEEEDCAVQNKDLHPHHVSPASMIIELLEVEDQQ